MIQLWSILWCYPLAYEVHFSIQWISTIACSKTILRHKDIGKNTIESIVNALRHYLMILNIVSYFNYFLSLGKLK